MVLRNRSAPRSRPRLPIALLALVTVLALAAPSSAGAVVLGISDSDAPTVTEPFWGGLGIDRARVVVPYDVAVTRGAAGLERRRRFERFRANAAARGVSLLVVFSASVDTLAPGTGLAVAPSAEQFAVAFAAFRNRYPEQRTLGAWNEPNNPDGRRYPLAGAPQLAAQYWLIAQASCPSCTVLAGEFAGIPGDDAYVDAYLAALGPARPAVWGIHAHTDVNAFQAGGSDSARSTRFYIGKLQGPWASSRIWIDEVGARFRNPQAAIWGDASQAQATQFLLGLATLDPRIDALYYYNYSNQCATAARCAVQDRGLVSPTPFDGSALGYDALNRPRAAYGVIAARGPVIAPAEPVPPAVAIEQPVANGAVATATPTFAGQAASGGHAAGEVALQLFTGAGSTLAIAPTQTLTAVVVDGRWSVTAAPLPDGVYSVRAAQQGNRTGAGVSEDVVFTVDTVAPTSELAAAPPPATGAREARVRFSASEPGVTYRCALDGGEARPCGETIRLTRLEPGLHTVGVRAIDRAGNVERRPTRHRWRVADLATALAPRLGALEQAFARGGLPIAVGCAGRCRVVARLYAPRTLARELGLARRSVSTRDRARPRGGDWVAVAGSSLTRSRTGGGTIALQLRRLAGQGTDPGGSLPLRLGVTLSGRGGEPTVMRERVTLARAGALRSLASRGLPATAACTFACTQRTRLWAPDRLGRALRANGALLRGARGNGLPRGGLYRSLAAATVRRERGGTTDLVLRPARDVGARLAGRSVAGLRATAVVTSPGSRSRSLSWPLTLPR